MQKDSSGHVGFLFKNGKITDLVKDTSAARNGLLTEHHMCEINGQNVVGMKVMVKIYFLIIRVLQAKRGTRCSCTFPCLFHNNFKNLNYYGTNKENCWCVVYLIYNAAPYS